jgi:hypothetical protein
VPVGEPSTASKADTAKCAVIRLNQQNRSLADVTAAMEFVR